MSAIRLGAILVAAGVLALGVLGPASARRSKFGGTLTIGLQAEPGALDPSLGQGTGMEVLPWICERLYVFDAKSVIEPQLAAALPTISPDHLTYTIPLRQGILFNDGTQFNADAVVTSIERMINLPTSARAIDFSSVDTVTATGPYTVVIHLRTRFTPLVATLAGLDGVVMSPAQLQKLGDNFGSDPVGVGPFMFDHRIIGDNITLIKSPNYYNKYAVHLDKLVYKFFSDTSAALAALEAGDIQVLSGLDPVLLPAVQQNPNIRVVGMPQLGYHAIQINLGDRNGVGNLPYGNVGTPLASSAKLRQAFEEAIDRTTYVRVALGGVGEPGCTLFAPGDPLYDKSFICTRYDLKDARKLVAQSGFTNPTVHLFIGNIGGDRAVREAEFIQSEEAAAGINVVIDTARPTGGIGSGNFDATFVTPIGSANPDANLYPVFATAGAGNISGYSNPSVDLALANARKATSPAALKTLYDTAQREILAGRPIIVLYHSVKLFGISTSVAGVQPYPDLIPHVAFAQYK
jgi:peptide/nickel transport system substrate-binding protein